MQTETIVIFPNTPLAKRITLDALRQLYGQGQVQADTPCIILGDPAVLTLAEVLARADEASAQKRSDDTAADALNADKGLTDEERYYLISNNLIAARDIAHLKRELALRMIAAHRRAKKTKQMAALAGLVVLVAAGVVAFWFLFLKGADKPLPERAAPAAEAPPPQQTREQRQEARRAAREELIRKSKADAAAKLEADRIEGERILEAQLAAEGSSMALYKERQREQAERDAAELADRQRRQQEEALAFKRNRQRSALIRWMGSSLISSDVFKDKIAAVYDASKNESPLSSAFVFSGIVGERKGRRYLFCPLISLCMLQQPAARMLNNNAVLDLRALPATFFGDWNVVAFDLGPVEPLSDAQKEALESEEGAVFGPATLAQLSFDAFKGSKTSEVAYVVGVNQGSLNSLVMEQVTLIPNGTGYWQVSTSGKNNLLGAVLISINTGEVLGVMSRQDLLPKHVNDRYLALDSSFMSEGQAIRGDVLLEELALLRQINARTEAFRALADKDLSRAAEFDGRVKGLVTGTAQKVKTALSRQIASMRDTTRVRDQFFTDLESLIANDAGPERFRIPSIQAEVSRQRQHRVELLKTASAEITDTDFEQIR